MLVKVCGITRESDAHVAAALGAGAIGFVLWPGSPRFIAPEAARTIRRALTPGVLTVGVFVNQGVAEVADLASRIGLGAIQLHGDEAPEEYASIGLPIIKAISTANGAGATDAAALPADVLVLIEGASPLRRGGAGVPADPVRAAAIAARRNAILAGGLTPDNVAAAIAAVRPFGVDVSSGVEIAPGIKDTERVRRFIAAVALATGGGTAR